MKTELSELMESRHSVRSYKPDQIEEEKREILISLIKQINEKTGLSIQIFFDEPKCFDSFMAHYGKFKGVNNYIALVGKKGKTLEEDLGYYGEEIVLKIQELGMNSCWVAMTHGKSQARIKKGESLRCLICFGYGENSGFPHKSKSIDQVSNYQEGMPESFLLGVKAALLAPTAINQQKFFFTLEDDGKVYLKKGMGFYTGLDLGIAKYHFEAVSGLEVS